MSGSEIVLPRGLPRSLSDPTLVARQRGAAVALLPELSYGNKGLLLGGSIEIGMVEYESEAEANERYDRDCYFKVPERYYSRWKFGWFGSPDGETSEVKLSRLYGMALTTENLPPYLSYFDLVGGFYTKLGREGADEDYHNGFAVVGANAGVTIYLNRPDAKASASDKDEIDLIAGLNILGGLGYGNNFNPDGIEGYFDREVAANLFVGTNIR